MLEFFDQQNNKVYLSFKKGAFSIEPRHVIVICRFQGKWLLTNHPQRGLECPGGKLENCETIEQAAIREVYEETGAVVQKPAFIGEYMVEDVQNGPFVKAILFSDIIKLEQKTDYLETLGPVLVEGDLASKVNSKEYSFIMKDLVVPTALKQALNLRLYV